MPVELTVSGRCTGVITMDTSVVHAHIAECPGPGSGPLKPGGNAEDCPRCTDPNPPYPFLCPGHPALEPGATW